MCLYIKKEAKPQIAVKNITVYKRLIIRETPLLSLYKSGDTFKSEIGGYKCEGKIAIEHNRLYFCTNSRKLAGACCRDRQGYYYSWTLDGAVDLTKTTINKKKIKLSKYSTAYKIFPIKIGEIYHSELKRYMENGYDIVEEGLHSFKSIIGAKRQEKDIVAECIIPKGSQYYIGTFNDRYSYASNSLKYIKII